MLQNWNSMPNKQPFFFFLPPPPLPSFLMANVDKQNKVDKSLGQRSINFSAFGYFAAYLDDEF